MAGVLNEADPLLTVNDLARLLKVSIRTVWRLRNAALVPAAMQIGGSIRWKSSVIQKWINDGCPPPGARVCPFWLARFERTG